MTSKGSGRREMKKTQPFRKVPSYPSNWTNEELEELGNSLREMVVRDDVYHNDLSGYVVGLQTQINHMEGEMNHLQVQNHQLAIQNHQLAIEKLKAENVVNKIVQQLKLRFLDGDVLKQVNYLPSK
jgi:hypothetical protein